MDALSNIYRVRLGYKINWKAINITVFFLSFKTVNDVTLNASLAVL